MFRRWLRTHLPHRDKIINHYSHLGRLKNYLSNPNLLRINCHSVSCGVAAGLFAAFIPLPLQTIIAICLAILFRGNLIIAVVITWISNPVTFVPIVYLIYKVGEWVTGEKVEKLLVPEFTIKFDNIHIFWLSSLEWISHFSKVYLIGLPIVAIGAAILGYFTVIVFWRGSVFLHKLSRKKNF